MECEIFVGDPMIFNDLQWISIAMVSKGRIMGSDYENNHMAKWNLFDVVNNVILKFPADL